jgi:hypothetical protein
MKKVVLLIVLLALSVNKSSATTYCPESIICTQQGCESIPQDFYLKGSFTPNLQYIFAEADIRSGSGTTCLYVNNSSQITVIAKKSHSPDRSIIGNQWIMVGGPGTGMYACQYDARKCSMS